MSAQSVSRKCVGHKISCRLTNAGMARVIEVRSFPWNSPGQEWPGHDEKRRDASRRTDQSERKNSLSGVCRAKAGLSTRRRPIEKSMTGGTARLGTVSWHRFRDPGLVASLRFNAINGRRSSDTVVCDHEQPTRCAETCRLPVAVEFMVVVPTLRCSINRQSVVGAWVAIAHSK